MTSNNRFDHDARGSHDRNRVYFVVFSRVRDERFRRFEFSSRGVDILCIWIHDISGFMTYHHMILTYLNFTYVFIFLDMNFDFFTSETRIRNVPGYRWSLIWRSSDFVQSTCTLLIDPSHTPLSSSTIRIVKTPLRFGLFLGFHPWNLPNIEMSKWWNYSLRAWDTMSYWCSEMA